MSESFYTYPSHSEGGGKRWVVFHKENPEWFVVNSTGLEIINALNRCEDEKDICAGLTNRYGISYESAARDISCFSSRLCQMGFYSMGESPCMQRMPSANSLYLHITDRCNLACPHCYFSSPEKTHKQELPTGLVISMIDQLAEYGGKSLTLSGGEPLLHPGIKEIIRHSSKNKKITVSVLSNGTLIDRECAGFLAGHGVYIQLSMDGSNIAVHDSIRGEGVFLKVVTAIHNLQEAGGGERLNLSATVMRQNIGDLFGIIEKGEALGVPKVRFLPLRRFGTACTQWNGISSGLELGNLEHFYKDAARLKAEGGSSIEISCGLSGFLLKLPEDAPPDGLWCPVGRRVVVDSNGDAYPCVLMMRDGFRIGNIYKQRLSGIVESEEMKRICQALSDRRDKIEKCSRCEWRNLCQAGCMGQALDHKGTIWDTDDFCGYRKRAYKDAFDRILNQEIQSVFDF
ncbi:PqqD family peptide modification chaperone [bacterium]|nr:PqqD family peptide modification chaperone [bacterium]